jgi:hypothetical protein
MRDFVKPDSTVIERVIYYSILVRDIRITLLQLRKTKIMMRGLGIMNLNFNDLTENELKLIHHDEEIQNACKQLLLPLFEGIDFGHKYLNHWVIPMSDIKQGYCELEEILQYKSNRPLLFGRKFVLLLGDYTDPTLGKFYSGELIELSKAIHFIDKIPPKKDKVKGLYDAIRNSITLASRQRSKIYLNE